MGHAHWLGSRMNMVIPLCRGESLRPHLVIEGILANDSALPFLRAFIGINIFYKVASEPSPSYYTTSLAHLFSPWIQLPSIWFQLY